MAEMTGKEQFVGEVDRLKENIENAYTIAEQLGATLPAEQNSDNLASTLETIQIGTGETTNFTKMYVTQTISGNYCQIAINSTGNESDAMMVGQVVDGDKIKLYLVNI